MLKKTLIPIIAAAAVVVPAAAANAAPNMEVAIQDEDVFVDAKTLNPDRGYDALDRLGVKRMRILMPLKAVQTGGGFDFGKYDRAVDRASARGVQTQLVLVGRYPRPNVGEFKRYAKAAATHFRGRVMRYSIWNEPNFKAWLAPVKKAPGLYRKLYAAGYKAVKSADRRAKVLMGETAPYAQGRNAMAPVKFLRQVACVNSSYKRVKRCPKLKTDGYAHHPYDFEKAPRRSKRGKDDATIGSLRNLTTALDKIARTGQIRGTKAVYLTEFGYLATGRRGLPEATRAKFLRQAYGIARKNRRVKQVVQYLLVQPGDSPFTTGILDLAGGETPSFSALASIAK
jgi:hypothetical protein